MRRIAIGTLAVALIAQLVGCSADAPTAPPAGGGGGNNGALQISLFTNDANPEAGACTMIQAVVTLNGANAPEGTGVSFSTDLGSFVQSSKQTVSVVTTGGTATTSICSPQSGVAHVRATASVQGKNGSANLPISFQSGTTSATLLSCSPSNGPTDGGTQVVISGRNLFGTAGTTRVTFTAAGITREALVTGINSTAISLVTPAFPEANSLGVGAVIQVTLGFGTPSAVTLTAPSCFVFGSSPVGTPNVTAVLPSSGKNDGNTRVAIIGSGFVAPLQVFFGAVEANVVSVTFNQIIVLSPPAFGVGSGNLNQSVGIRVHEVNSGTDSNTSITFRYGPAVQITSASNTTQPGTGPFTPVTIFGQGFQAPVAVSLAGVAAQTISVSATEVVAMPSAPAVSGCNDISGAIRVVNIDTGDGADGPDFFYLVKAFGPLVTGLSASSAPAGSTITIFGANLANTSVTIGGTSAAIVGVGAGGTSLSVRVPDVTPPNCPTGTSAGTQIPSGGAQDIVVTAFGSSCATTFSGAFTTTAACVAVATPTPTP